MPIRRATPARSGGGGARPDELIPDYVTASIGAVPAAPGVDPLYRKRVDANGIPVLSSDKVPDAALLVMRDIVNTMLAARSDLRRSMIDPPLAHRRDRRSGDDSGHSRVRQPQAP